MCVCVRVRVYHFLRTVCHSEDRLMFAAGPGIIQRAVARVSHQSRDYQPLQQGRSLITSLLIISFSVARLPQAIACECERLNVHL